MIILSKKQEKIEIFEKQIDDLGTQCYKLGTKAATAYHDLTPRYKKFPEIFSEFNLRFDDQEKGNEKKGNSK